MNHFYVICVLRCYFLVSTFESASILFSPLALTSHQRGFFSGLFFFFF